MMGMAILLLPAPSSAHQAAAPADSLEVVDEAREAVREYVRAVVTAPGLRSHGVHEYRREVVEEQRPEVIEALDSAAGSAPEDDWIVGHRVGFRIKEGRLEEARDVARQCRGSEWWCRALEGKADHLLGDSLAAHRAFEASLEAMTEDQRCGWRLHLRYVVRYHLQDRYDDADCQEQEELASRIWWLADPFHIEEWNNRRSEHFARVVGKVLRQQTDEFLGAGSRDPSSYTGALRRGWPDWWWSHEGPPETGRSPGDQFLPRWVPKVEDPFGIGAGSWDLLPREEADERAELGYDIIHHLPQQTAFFRRGDGIRALVAADTDAHELRGAWSLDVGAALSSAPDERYVERASGEPDRFVLDLEVPNGEYLVSVEAVAERSGAARARFGHRLPEPAEAGAPAVSDLVLFDWDDDVEERLESVKPRILGTNRISRSRDLGVFWETYGVGDGERVEVSFSARAADQGRLRRLGERLRILGSSAPVRYSWEEVVVGEDDVRGRVLRVDLSALDAGEYVLELEVEGEDGSAVVASRGVDVRPF